MKLLFFFAYYSTLELVASILWHNESSAGRVVDAHEAHWPDWSFMVAFIVTTGVFGSGALVSSDWVLSTCSLLSWVSPPFYNSIQLIAGTSFLYDETLGQWRTVALIVPHEYCSFDSVYISDAGVMLDYAIVQVRCELAGWGGAFDQYRTAKIPSSVLLLAEHQIIQWEKCTDEICTDEDYSFPYCSWSVIMTGKICAKPIKGVPCQGDVGSLLVCDGHGIALLSVVGSCGEADQPDRFARLDVALHFLRNYIDLDIITSSAKTFHSTSWSITIVISTFTSAICLL